MASARRVPVVDVECNGETFPQQKIENQTELPIPIPFGSLELKRGAGNAIESFTVSLSLPSGDNYAITLSGVVVRAFSLTSEERKLIDRQRPVQLYNPSLTYYNLVSPTGESLYDRLAIHLKEQRQKNKNNAPYSAAPTPEEVRAARRSRSRHRRSRSRRAAAMLLDRADWSDDSAPGSVTGHASSKMAAADDENALWVQCDRCTKWRRLPKYVEEDLLPKTWYCELNPNTKYNHCSVPQENVASHADTERPSSSRRKRNNRGRGRYRMGDDAPDASEDEQDEAPADNRAQALELERRSRAARAQARSLSRTNRAVSPTNLDSAVAAAVSPLREEDIDEVMEQVATSSTGAKETAPQPVVIPGMDQKKEEVDPAVVASAVAETSTRKLSNDGFCGICKGDATNEDPFIHCAGPCARSFHAGCATLKPHSSSTDSASKLDWYCKDCFDDQHHCFACGGRGVDGVDVVRCTVDKSCGKFYHIKCPQFTTTEDAKNTASPQCLQHECHKCKGAVQGALIVCRQCPLAYHRECAPTTVSPGARSFTCPKHAKKEDDIEPQDPAGPKARQLLQQVAVESVTRAHAEAKVVAVGKSDLRFDTFPLSSSSSSSTAAPMRAVVGGRVKMITLKLDGDDIPKRKFEPQSGDESTTYNGSNKRRRN